MSRMRTLAGWGMLLLAAAAASADREELAMAEPAAAGLSAQRPAQMEESIRAGDFKQTTSVLLARDSKLTIDRYFDAEGAEGLRNRRSATKTVTGMLV